MKKIYIIAATQYKLNKKQIFLINLIKNIFRNKVTLLSNNKLSINKKLKVNAIKIEMDDSLFDFSRYFSAISFIKDKESIIFAFNDTLGNGRKLNFGLYVFIIISLFFIKLEIYDFASPVDKSFSERWICPYFFLGKYVVTSTMNWTNYDDVIKKLNSNTLTKLHFWVNSKWRQADNSSNLQKEIKVKTLILERNLINNIYKNKYKIFAFNKYSIFRIINSIFPF